MKSFETSTIINGPLNVIRLINYHNNKIIYLFFDQHIYKSKCDEKYALDIKQYLLKELKKAKNKHPNIIYDLFIESLITRIIDPVTKKGENYLREVTTIFWSKLDLIDKNKISIIEDNIRLHYIDIREYYLGKIFDYLESIDTYIKNGELNYLISDTKKVISYIQIINNVKKNVDMFENEKNKSISEYIKTTIQNKYMPSNQERLEIYTKMIYKMFYSYSNEENKIIISRELNKIFNEIKYLLDSIVDFLKHLDYININNKNFKDDNKLYKLSNKINSLYINIISSIMDLYIIRRIVDKEYVTNSILYVGALHGSSIIYYLVKYFDYEITHFYKSSINDIENLNHDIKFKLNKMDIDKIFNNKYQCVNMKSFPIYFT